MIAKHHILWNYPMQGEGPPSVYSQMSGTGTFYSRPMMNIYNVIMTIDWKLTLEVRHVSVLLTKWGWHNHLYHAGKGLCMLHYPPSFLVQVKTTYTQLPRGFLLADGQHGNDVCVLVWDMPNEVEQATVHTPAHGNVSETPQWLCRRFYPQGHAWAGSQVRYRNVCRINARRVFELHTPAEPIRPFLDEVYADKLLD